MTGTQQALTSATLEAQMCVHPQNRALPNVFNDGNLAEPLIGTRVTLFRLMEINTPATLREAITYFSDPNNCVTYMAGERWPNGVTCPACGSTKVSYDARAYRWQCASRHPKSKFSLKAGTILEDSPLGLDKWLRVIWLVTNCHMV